MSVFRVPFLLGLSVGLFVTMALPARAEPGVPVQVLGAESWAYMSGSQRQMVDIMAKDIFETTLSASQRERITGSRRGRYEQLPDWRKAPFRGAAMRQLGHDSNNTRGGSI